LIKSNDNNNVKVEGNNRGLNAGKGAGDTCMKNMYRRLVFKWILTACVALVTLWPTAAPTANITGHLESSWNRLISTLSETLDLRDKQETLPDSSYFGADKISNAKKINALLDQSIKILLQGEANDMREQAVLLRIDIPALQLERNNLRNKRISAPETSKMPWEATRSKIDEQIAKLDVEITEKEKALSDINAKITEELRKIGLNLDDRQIDIFLTSVTGDDFFQNTVVFANVKLVVSKLSELSREDRDNLEISRRYTGLYLVLNDLLIVTQEGLIEKIDRDYIPRLAAIRGEAEKLRAEALERAEQSQYPQSQQQVFKSNAEANGLTVRVAELYAELLENQRRNTMATLAELFRSRDVAENTYRTVRSTGDLRNLIRSGLELFDSIHVLSMPQFQPFENETIRKEFEEINKRLRR
jgi:hypothetical protein